MTIAQAKRIKVGDRVRWTGPVERGETVTGTVTETGYLGIKVQWDRAFPQVILFDDAHLAYLTMETQA